MTLDEAIEHAKEVARTCDDGQCAAEHAQLAEWLRQARGADKAAKWYTAKIRELEAENAKLRKMVRDMRKAFFTLDIDHCQACPRDTINGPCTKYLVGGSDECSFEEDMRELGIETDDD